MGLLTDKTVAPACPNCAAKMPLKLGELRDGNKVTCPGCGAEIEFKGEGVGAGLDKLDAALERLKKL